MTSPADPTPPAGPEPQLVPDAESLLTEAAGHIRAIATGAERDAERALAWLAAHGL